LEIGVERRTIGKLAKSASQWRSLMTDGALIKTRRERLQTLSIGLSGVAMALTPAPLHLWPLAWIALAPLWVAVVATPGSYRRWVILGLLWGIGYHGLTISWITGLHPLMWLGVPWLGSIGIVAFAWSFMSLWGGGSVAIWALGLGALARGTGFSSRLGRVLIGTTLWVGIEAARSASSLDWTSLALTQSPGNLAILHLSQLSGALTVTAAIVAVNGLLAEAWLARSAPKTASLGQSAPALLITAIGLFASLHFVGWQLFQQPLADRPDQALNVGLIQGNIPTRKKLFSPGIAQAFERYSSGYRKLADQGVDFVLTPEGALPLVWQAGAPSDPLLDNSLSQAIREKGVPIGLGTFRQNFFQGTARDRQGLQMIDGLGRTTSRYDKIALVPLGESLPLEPILGKLISRLSPIKGFLQPGERHQRFETPWGPAAVGICYESAFGELFRDQVAAGAGFLLTASNLDPYSEVLMAQHQAHDLIRAIETDRWIVRATNTGYSGIINPHGQIQWQSQAHEPVSHADRIYRRSRQTPYTRYGNWLLPLLGVISLIALVGSARADRRG
jgi:apolipoprotein N-acyltransferase